MTYTDAQLKQALAKMLPETDYWWDDEDECLYASTKSASRRVLNTELLHLCWLVEETMNCISGGKTRYEIELTNLCNKGEHNKYHTIHATWQQRTIALAKVKGIEIV